MIKHFNYQGEFRCYEQIAVALKLTNYTHDRRNLHIEKIDQNFESKYLSLYCGFRDKCYSDVGFQEDLKSWDTFFPINFAMCNFL